MSNIVRSAYRHGHSDGNNPICEADAAVRATNEVDDLKDALIIVTPSGKRLGYIPPLMPSKIPECDEWDALKNWELPKQTPPKGLSSVNNDAIPHIRLDTVLNELIGDKCP